MNLLPVPAPQNYMLTFVHLPTSHGSCGHLYGPTFRLQIRHGSLPGSRAGLILWLIRALPADHGLSLLTGSAETPVCL